MRAKQRLEMGDRPGFEEDAQTFETLVNRMRSDFRLGNVAIWDAMKALLEGRYADVPEAAEEVLKRGEYDPSFTSAWASLHIGLSRDLGDREQEHALMQAAMEQVPGLSFVMTAGLASSETDPVEARRLLVEASALSEGRFVIPPNEVQTVTLLWLAEAVCRLRDRERAVVLHERLAEVDPTTRLMVGPVAVICLGAVDRIRGMLAATLGDYEVAERAFEAAVALEEEIGSPPQAARTRVWWARMLLDRAGDGDAERAAAILRESIEVASSLGMKGVASEAEQLLARTPG